MEHTDPLEIIKEGLGGYPLTPLIAEAIKFFLTNRYESLVIINEDGEIEFMDRPTEKFHNLLRGEGKGKKITEIIPYSELPDVVSTGIPHIGKILKAKDRHLLNSRFPLVRDEKVVGAFGKVILSSFEELERVTKEADQYRRILLNAERKMKSEYQATYRFDHILGVSEKMTGAKELAKRMARTFSDILIQGESGTGKELFAHAIHNESGQKSYPFIKINCPAIPIEIAESELFGYEKGAFTGAKQEGKPGKFELAEGGTIFLDEIGALPLSIQAKLLRVIQEREIERLGSKKTLKLNFRLITATNIDLKKLAEEGKFRFDLFFRLSKGILTLPSLRERQEDIPIYVSHFLKILSKSLDTKIRTISQEALDLLRQYHWPGNVRELTNILEQSFYNMRGAEVLLPEHLPNELKINIASSYYQSQQRGKPLRKVVEEIERDNILNALKLNRGNKRKTAMHLGIQRSALYLKMKRFGLM
ncbi:MAG: sigma-54 interaction domain-containing protein [Thermodesulfobacteriota bacterium]